VKTYHGQRFDEGCEVWVEESGKRYPLPFRTEIRNHSPTGFNWGYSGSGPAQLALAILADFYGPAKAPDRCPFCEAAVQDWRCIDVEHCGYDGTKEDKWAHIRGRTIHYQDFKALMVANLPPDKWSISGTQIEAWAEDMRKARP